MPFFLSIGVSKAEFDDSTPIDMEVYAEAEKMRQRRSDIERWHQGMYNLSAFSVALARALSKKTKAEYVKEPMSEKALEKTLDAQMTEEEKSVERGKLLMALQTMQANFELNHRNDQGERQ